MHYANTLKTAVACALLGSVAATTIAAPAHAQPKFDRRIAKLLADRAAAALGELRLGPADEAVTAPETTETFFGQTMHDAIETGSIRSYAPQPAGRKAEDAEALRPYEPRDGIRVVYAG